MNNQSNVISMSGRLSSHKDAGLQSGDIDDTLDSMSDISRDEIDAKIAAAEARTETKLTGLESKIDALTITLKAAIDANNASVTSALSATNIKLDNLKDNIGKADDYNHQSRWIIISTVIGSAIAILAISISVISLFPPVLTIGTQIKDLVDHSVELKINKTDKK